MTTPLVHVALACLGLGCAGLRMAGSETPFMRGELISATENLHNDGSCIVAPNGDLLVGWFNEAWIRRGD
jgi:hypothetical protein